MIYLEIAVNIPRVSGSFHYHLPPELEGQVRAGHLVEVPFGQQRVQGVVLREVIEPEVSETRPVFALVDTQVVLTEVQLALAKDLAEHTLAPLSACANLMVPVGINQVADTLYEIVDIGSGSGDLGELDNQQSAKNIESLGNLQKRLMAFLEQRGALRGRQIDNLLPHVNWRGAAQSLVRRRLLQTKAVLPPPTSHPKTVRTAQLACAPEIAEADLPHLAKAGSQALNRRQAVMRFLIREPGPVNVAWVYAESGGNSSDLQALVERGLVMLGDAEVWRDPVKGLDFVLAEPPILTRDQQLVWSTIRNDFPVLRSIPESTDTRPLRPFLLHGVTGSGKTEIYLRAVDETLRMGKQAIVLVPEIALTPQTIRRFLARFPGQVGLTHSGLSSGERYDTWRRARAGLISVMVGPRSALFTPFPKLGLIVVDECHDDSYYQDETPPYYHAREVAVSYARLAGAICLLGSATPDIVSRYRAIQEVPPELPVRPEQAVPVEPVVPAGQVVSVEHQFIPVSSYRYVSLPARILAHRQAVQAQVERLGLSPNSGSAHYRLLEEQAEMMDLPPVQVVDMRQELKVGNRSIFSQALHTALAKVLENGQQAILFLNRRGTATYVFCRECGHVMKCPRCDIPLTYHVEPATSEHADCLICHHCDYTRQMPRTCPKCKSTYIRQYGTGTERVESEVQVLFPQARLLRWDWETTRQKGAHEAIMSRFAAHQADVLVGTQMLAKGLDLPFVTLVGVVLADVGLNLPDYRASERTFQVLTQVAGRAGRSPLGGQVVLQTFEPDHYVIQAAARHDYAGFYQKELEYRRQLGYPPFTQLVRLEYRHAQAERAETAAKGLAVQIQNWIVQEERRATQIIGPAPCFFSRVNNQYRWQIILRGPDPVSLLRSRLLKNSSFSEWRIEVNPVSLL